MTATDTPTEPAPPAAAPAPSTISAGDSAPVGVLDVLVVGAGQAGLSMAWHLARRGVRYLLIDAAPGIGHSWRTRWDSLKLFTSARYDGLPGEDFPGAPHSYPDKDQVAHYLSGYAGRRVPDPVRHPRDPARPLRRRPGGLYGPGCRARPPRGRGDRCVPGPAGAGHRGVLLRPRGAQLGLPASR